MVFSLLPMTNDRVPAVIRNTTKKRPQRTIEHAIYQPARQRGNHIKSWMNVRHAYTHVHRNTYDKMFIVQKSYKPCERKGKEFDSANIFYVEANFRVTTWLKLHIEWRLQSNERTHTRVCVVVPLHIRIAAFFPFLQCTKRDKRIRLICARNWIEE